MVRFNSYTKNEGKISCLTWKGRAGKMSKKKTALGNVIICSNHWFGYNVRIFGEDSCP